MLAMISVFVAFVLPLGLIQHWKKTEALFDAIGLSAFAIQGALYATQMNHPMSAVIVAAVLTGSGGEWSAIYWQGGSRWCSVMRSMRCGP